MEKAVVYARVSSEEQAKHGFSIDNQKRQCIEFVEKQGYSVVKVFVDEEKSWKLFQKKSHIKIKTLI